MTRPLLFATTNPGKLRELRALAGGLSVLSLEDFPGIADVVEDEETLQGNARKKALAYARATGVTALADDSGLCVDALGGRPGVHSARYAPGDDAARWQKLLQEMKDVPEGERTASFQCALCLATPEGDVTSEVGRCEGRVLHVARGTGGFGYDPVLWVTQLGRAMAELTLEEKALVSHRGQAFARMRARLLDYQEGRWP